jgi:hypothetical protein
MSYRNGWNSRSSGIQFSIDRKAWSRGGVIEKWHDTHEEEERVQSVVRVIYISSRMYSLPGRADLKGSSKILAWSFLVRRFDI